MSISDKNIVKIIAVIWLSIAFLYLMRVPEDMCTTDLYWHFQYTEFIVHKNKFPTTKDIGIAYHPPLYHFINSFITPPITESDKSFHIKMIKMLSVIYGLIAALLINWFLKNITNDNFTRLLVVLFIATTPAFFFTFTGYNNDSLATLLSISISAISYKLYKNWSSSFAKLLFFLALAGVYTKYSVAWCIIVICILCLFDFIRNKFHAGNQIKIILILIFAVMSLMPWAIFHNYNSVGKLFPCLPVDEHLQIGKFDLPQHINTLKTILKIPFISYTPGEWKLPWAKPFFHESSKASDYISYSLVSSIFGEYEFTKPDILFFWIIFWIHCALYIFAIKEIFSSGITKTAGAYIFLRILYTFFILLL